MPAACGAIHTSDGPREDHSRPSQSQIDEFLRNCTLVHVGDSSSLFHVGRHELVQCLPNLLATNGSKDSEEGFIMKRPLDKREFLNERRMLQLCHRRSVEHVVSLISSFIIEEIGYIVMPAALTDLAALWYQSPANIPTKTYGRSLQTWFTTQLRGLAEALGIIHTQLGTSTRPIFGIHGDIKASNILVFPPHDNQRPFGDLKLADFGMSQFFDSLEEASRITNGGAYGSYAAPECVLEQPFSQAADLWSFGCLMMDGMVWLHQGATGLQDFAASRKHQSYPYGMSLAADYFFKMEPEKEAGDDRDAFVRAVNPAVLERITALGHDAEEKSRETQVLDIIKDGLLQIDPGRRISARTLSSRLM